MRRREVRQRRGSEGGEMRERVGEQHGKKERKEEVKCEKKIEAERDWNTK